MTETVTLTGVDPVTLDLVEYVMTAEQAAAFERGEPIAGYGDDDELLVDEHGLATIRRHLDQVDAVTCRPTDVAIASAVDAERQRRARAIRRVEQLERWAAEQEGDDA